MTLWKCSVCGYIYEGDDAPENCPHCGAPKEKFEKLGEEKVDLITKSSETNDLHMELASLLDQMLAVAEVGLEINLDPGCVKIFTQALENATSLRQRIKAEINVHISKGKWG